MILFFFPVLCVVCVAGTTFFLRMTIRRASMMRNRVHIATAVYMVCFLLGALVLLRQESYLSLWWVQRDLLDEVVAWQTGSGAMLVESISTNNNGYVDGGGMAAPIIVHTGRHGSSSREVLKTDRGGVSHCFFRRYEKPDIHSGLPFVGEVFASHDRSSVFVVAEGRKFCQRRYEKAHDFHSTPERQVRFRCIFESDGSRTLSDPVHGRLKTAAGYVLIRCPVPRHLQTSVPPRGSPRTRSHLTLESMFDLEAEQNFVDVGRLPAPRLRHLPICSHAWPSEDDADEGGPPRSQQQDTSIVRSSFATITTTRTTTKRKVSLMTRIRISYQRGANHESVSVSQVEYLSWIEYHLAIGIEHFYIYDDSVDPRNSSVRAWSAPYMARGVLTYVHYPYEDIECDTRARRMYTGQIVSSNAVFRRYESETEWMGIWDVDEYLVVRGASKANTLLSDLVDEYGQKFDEIHFRSRPTYGICQNTTASAAAAAAVADPPPPQTLDEITPPPPFEEKQCMRIGNEAGKGIYRASAILQQSAHRAFIRMNGRAQKQQQRGIVDPPLGHVAHFRKGKAGGDTFPVPSDAFVKWIDPIKRNLQQKLLQKQ